MEKCKQLRMHKYTFTILRSSWRCNSSKTRLQSCQQANSAKNTVIPTSGPVVKKHNFDQEWENNSVQYWQFVPIAVPGLSSSSSAWGLIGYLPESSKTAKSSIGKPRRSENQKKKNKKKGSNQAMMSRLRDISKMVRGVHRSSRRYRSASTRKHFSKFRFGTSCESGTKEA